MDRSKSLLSSSSDESFEHIDPEFDNSYYPELKGVATADYIPLEKDEIVVQKGDQVIIAEQTLDQTYFLVVNIRTTSEGKVPCEYIRIVTEDTSMEDTGELVHVMHSDLHWPLAHQDADTESDLDNSKVRRSGVIVEGGDDLDCGKAQRRRRRIHLEEEESDLDSSVTARVIPGKKSGRMGIMRRKGVSKSKGSPYRSSGSSHDEDLSPLVSAGKNLELRRNDLSRKTTPPAADFGPPQASSLISSAKVESSRRAEVEVDKHRSHTLHYGVDGFHAYPPLEDTKEERPQAMAALPLQPEYKHIEKYNIVSVSGADRDGRPVVVFSACRLPPTYLINHQRLFEYLLFTLDQYVEQDYTVLYFHHGFSSANKPNLSWIRQVYLELDRKYKKNLKKFYIVHPTNFVRMLMILLKPLISYKFGRKITYINRLEELRPVLFLEQVDIPKEVQEYDARLMSQIRKVAKTDSRSMFHVPPAPTTNSSFNNTVPHSKQQFGVPLDVLRRRYSEQEEFVPVVVRRCVEYLEQEGLEVMGIFRRAPNNIKCRMIKRQFDLGEEVSMFECADPHIAAVLIKMFLRELPEPLLTFAAYSKVVGMAGQKEQSNRLRLCCDVVHNLPKENYDLLNYLMAFIDKVCAHEEVNKMNALNLAIVFGPNLIWSTDQAASLVGLGEINSFTNFMIQNRQSIFTK